MRQLLTDGFEATRQAGEEFAATIKHGGIVTLHGDLGSGKTTFVQGIAKGLGITKQIISPTFIIMRTYEVGNNQLYHVDLYRIENERDVEGIGLLELLDDPQNIILIEWPDKIEHLLPGNRIAIYFEYLGEDKRKITYKE